jgi:hypothetical protein
MSTANHLLRRVRSAEVALPVLVSSNMQQGHPHTSTRVHGTAESQGPGAEVTGEGEGEGEHQKPYAIKSRTLSLRSSSKGAFMNQRDKNSFKSMTPFSVLNCSMRLFTSSQGRLGLTTLMQWYIEHCHKKKIVSLAAHAPGTHFWMRGCASCSKHMRTMLRLAPSRAYHAVLCF